MLKKEFIMQSSQDSDARPIAIIVQTASHYSSDIYIEKSGIKLNAKSIMGMMSLGLEEGEKILVSADGEDEKQAIDAFEKFFNK